MKKLYRKGTVHPSPPLISDQLSFLPATIFTLTAALSPEDREVLAYLISYSSNNTPPSSASFSNFSGNSRRGSASEKGGAVDAGDHAPVFNCCCFRCYMSYWVRWDSSPNRQLIHEIIEGFEDWLARSSSSNNNNNKGGKNRKEKRNKRGNKQPGELKRNELVSSERNESNESESAGEGSSCNSSSGSGGRGEGGDGVQDEEKGSVRKFVSFIGERIWGAWGQ